ncbi:sensor histidine kinase [Cysteiniphilum halobium]|uniref:sensor histidine kinase n=1 Tax=Cysteiniphilum halobium TaxID=2219059 RepID=UPI000E6517BB|nr:HAMP domain-containing sensor histidine kinase [Cysteiniphilum halobium]
MSSHLAEKINIHFTTLFQKNYISFPKLISIMLILVILNSFFITAIHLHYHAKYEDSLVQNSLFSLLRIRNQFLTQAYVEPRFVHFQTEVNRYTQLNQFNIIFQKVSGSYEINSAFIDNQLFDKMHHALRTNHQLFITSPIYNDKNHKVVTFYVFLNPDDDLPYLLSSSISISIAIILLLFFMWYLARFILPKLLLSSATTDEKVADLPKYLNKDVLALKQQIQLLLQEKTIMLSSMSHDMKNSLTKLNLLKYIIDNKKAREILSQEIDEMQMIINSSLAFAERDNHNAKVNFDLCSFLDNFYQQLCQRGYTFTFNNKLKAHTFFLGYPNLLKRALLNIINNAVKYAPHYTLDTYIQDDHIIIDIKDNGPGICASDVKNIAKAFTRSQHDLHQHIDGHGLGLAITRVAIEFNSGKLSFENLKPSGLLVRIFLPMSKN